MVNGTPAAASWSAMASSPCDAQREVAQPHLPVVIHQPAGSVSAWVKLNNLHAAPRIQIGDSEAALVTGIIQMAQHAEPQQALVEVNARSRSLTVIATCSRP